MAEGVSTGAVDPTMERVLTGGLSLEWKTVGDILVPRVDVVGVEAGASYDECVDVFRRKGYSRLFVSEGSLDADAGYLAVKDLVRLEPQAREGWTARNGARESLRVPTGMALPLLLGRMRRSGVHFAVVKDEYGGTEGIVTLEDLLEELVGEIRDEHDVGETPPIRRAQRAVWLVRGDVAVKEVNARLRVRIPAEEARTIGGYLAEALGRVPEQGDAVTHAGVRLVVDRVKGKRVLQVRVEGATSSS